MTVKAPLSLVVLFVFATVAVCPAAPRTEIEYVPYQLVGGVPRDSVDIVPALYNLSNPRKLQNSRRVPSKREQAAFRTAVEREASQLPVRGVEVEPEVARADATLRCDLRCHRHEMRSAKVVSLLPVPHVHTITLCVETRLVDTRTGELLNRHEEWGYASQKGFWRKMGKMDPPLKSLREYLVKKSFVNLLKDIDDCNRKGMLPKP